jgi:septum formation protein
MERKSLRIPEDNDDDDEMPGIPSSSIPNSPTDSLLSPCSRKIILRKAAINGSGSGSGSGQTFSRRSSKMSYTLNIEQEEPATKRHIVLGTSSSSRQKIIAKLGWQVSVIIPDINEKSIRSDDPYNLPLVIAKAKADEVVRKIKSNSDMNEKDMIIITADQVVYFNGEVREKPTNEDEAKSFLLSYSNSSVSTISAIVVTHYPSGQQKSEVNESKVYWNTISARVVDKVVSKGAIYQSAGGFRVEDEDLNGLINNIEGSVSCIMGLNVVTLQSLLRSLELELSG